MDVQGELRSGSVPVPGDGAAIKVGELTLDGRRRLAWLLRQPLTLTPREFDLLVTLASRPGWVFSPEQLLREVWGYQYVEDARLVSVHLSNLRRKLAAVDPDGRYLHNIRGVGYKLEPPERRRGTPERDFFVGRRPELDQLLEAFSRASGGAGQVVVVLGEPGMGKTALAEEFALRAEGLGAQVAWGRGHSGEAAPPYWLWVQVLRSLIRGIGDQDLASNLGTFGPDLTRVLPELNQRLPELPVPDDLPPEQARFRVFQGIATLLTGLSANSPQLLVLDDIHWAEDGSLLALEFLAKQLGAARVVLLATSREAVGQATSLSRTLAELSRVRSFRQLSLTGLSRDECRELIEAVTKKAPTDPLVFDLFERSEGNPFFLAELARLMGARGHLAAERLAHEPGILPPSVQEAVAFRLGTLSAECRQLLARAAVLGRHFLLSRLSQLNGISSETVLELLSEAEAARVVTGEPSGFRFSHALVQEVLYASLTLLDRVRLHQRAGEAIEEEGLAASGEVLAELARHFSGAGPLSAGKAVGYLLLAGREAAARFSFTEAAQLFEKALCMLQLADHPLRERLEKAAQSYEALGEARFLAGDLEAALEAFSSALELLPAGDPLARARLNRRKAEVALELRRIEAASESLSAALGALGDRPVPDQPEDDNALWWREWLEVHLKLLALEYWGGRPGEHPPASVDFEEALSRWGTPLQRGEFEGQQVLVGLHRQGHHPTSETLAHALAQHAAVSEANSPTHLCWAEIGLANVYVGVGELDKAERHAQEAVRLAERASHPLYLVVAHLYLATVSRMRGDLTATIVRARYCIEVAAGAWKDNVAAAQGHLAWAAGRQGDVDQAEEHALTALAGWANTPAFPYQWLARWPMLAVCLRRGRLAEAVDQASHMLLPSQHTLPGPLATRLQEAVSAWDDGRTAGAKRSLLQAVQQASGTMFL